MDIFVGADTSQWQGEFKVIGEVAIFTGHDFATGWYQQCADQCNLHAREGDLLKPNAVFLSPCHRCSAEIGWSVFDTNGFGFSAAYR